MMVLRILRLTAARAFTDWALREIDPLHPDVPMLRMRQVELDDAWRRLVPDDQRREAERSRAVWQEVQRRQR